MNRNKAIITIMAIVVTAGAGAFAAPQTECPVMGGKINKSLYADVNGKRIYVCCKGCIAKVKAAPAKYIKQLEGKGVELDKAAPKKEATSSKGGCGGCGSH